MTRPDAEPGAAELPEPETLHWIEVVTGRRVVAVEREHAGGSRHLWYVDLDSSPVGAPAVTRTVLRVDTGGGALDGSPYTLDREAAVYAALGPTDVPVPQVVAARPGALLLERVTGTSRLNDRHASELVNAFMSAVGSLHGLDPTALGLAGVTTTLAAVRDELAAWRDLADRATSTPDPLVEYAFAWLAATAARLPRAGEPPVLVQGDTGPGNFVADGPVLTGLVDWELSHLGDPMDDLAWIDMRCGSMSGPFGDTGRRDHRYLSASPFAIDTRSLAFHAVLVRLRCVVTTARTLTVGGGALGLVVYAPPHHRFREELALALVTAIGADVSPDEQIDPVPSALADLAEDAIVGLRDVVLPAAAGPHVKLRARAALLALEHHREMERLGPGLARAEHTDRRVTLGQVVDDRELATLAARAGAVGDATVLGLLHRSARRSRTCWNVPAARSGPASAPPHRTETPHPTSEGTPRHV